VLLKSDKHNGYFARIHVQIYDNSSVDYSQNENFLRQTLKSVLIFSTCSMAFFLNRTVYEVIWKNVVKPHRSQTAI
jgi:hypothetical protein